MAVSKSWAYVTEYGKEIVQAWELAEERAKYGNEPLDKVFWSNHQTGLRKPVVHTIRNGTTFFAYKGGHGGGGPGESLSHKLMKRAIASMAGTKLSLADGFGEHPIQVTHGETEKLIEKGPYRADAYLQFTSPTWLGLRWAGEVYIEVRHEHAVPIEKQKALQAAEVPVVEVPLADIFLYGEDDDTTTPAKEAAHVARLRNLLQKGFLKGKVIGDRITIEFLRQRVEWLEDDVKRLGNELDAAHQANAQTAQQLATAISRVAELEGAKKRLGTDLAFEKSQRDALQKDFDGMRGKAAGLASDLMAAQSTLAEAQQENRWLWWSVAAATLALAAVVGTLAAHAFFGSAEAAPVEAVMPAPQLTPTPAPAASKPAKKVKRAQPVKTPAPTQESAPPSVVDAP